MSIPLDASEQIFKDPRTADKLRKQFGGTREVDRDGSVYSSIGNRPVPPPKALRKIHADRQAEIQAREEDKEADETMLEYGMGIKENATYMNSADRSAEATRRRRRLAQQNLEVRLCDTAHEYIVQGCGLPECNGCYTYSTASCHGAPVYQSSQGWTLHRDRPPVESTVGTESVVSEFGWLISKGGKPFYAVKTEDMVAPSESWECFLGPQPAPTSVTHTSWETYFLQSCGELKDAGNAAMAQARYGHAHEKYSEAIEKMDGFDEMLDSSEKLRQLHCALHANRAEVRLRMCRWLEARSDCERVLEREPAHAKASARLSKACRALGCSGDAVVALRRALQDADPKAKPALQMLLDEAELLSSCEVGSSRLAGLYRDIQLLREQLQDKRWQDLGNRDAARRCAQVLRNALKELDSGPDDEQLAREIGLLFRSTSVVDLVLAAVTDATSVDAEVWSIELLSACVRSSMGDVDLRRILDGLPDAVPKLVESPIHSLELVKRLLRHRMGQQLKVADRIIEAPGLLAGCLQPWSRLLEDGQGHEHSESACEVFHALCVQVVSLDNAEALALALFVESFVGQKFERDDGTKAVTGGFVLYSGGSVRQVVSSLLRRWAQDERILHSLSPKLVGRVWLSVLTKLRRDAGLEVDKQIPTPGGKRALKLEWFKLRRTQELRRGAGAFHPEELLEALLMFLSAHLKGICTRGCEQSPEDGIAARHPAEEWMEEVLDRPFGWGVLLPLVVSPPPVSTAALSLLEQLIDSYPHEEKLAKRLAGMHVFMPLLRLPWPVGPTAATSHLSATMALGSSTRCSVARLLRCTIDTEIGLRVVQDHPSPCVGAAVRMLMGTLADGDRPRAVVAATEVLGIFMENLGCWDEVPDEAISSVVTHLVRGTSVEIRGQLSKLLRHALSSESAGSRVRRALEDDELGLDDQQRAVVLQEIFDVRTLAGQAKAEMMMKLQQEKEQTPVGLAESGEKRMQHVKALVEAIHQAYLQHLAHPRVLIIGRIARALCRNLGLVRPNCSNVLGEMTLEKLSSSDIGPSTKAVLLPMPRAVGEDPELSSGEKFDVIVAGEPAGYCDIGEYAHHLRPFIKRREKEEEKCKDQVQCICVELQERLEDTRDELFSAGYYSADHDKSLEGLRRLARRLDYGVALFSLPSEEKENRKLLDEQRAVERRLRLNREDEAKADREEEEDRRRGVLYEMLFDPLLSTPESDALPVVCDLGVARGQEDLLLIWLRGNSEEPGGSRGFLASLCDTCPRLRVVEVGFPEGQSRWYRWTDQDAVSFGAEWFEMAGGPTKEDAEEAAKDPARNISFGRPSFQELEGLEELEVSCKQLLNLLEEEVVSLGDRPRARIAIAGFSQGGAVAAYAALGGLASEEVQSRLCAIVPCCSGVPVLHFLAPKLQAACLAARDEGVHTQPISIHAVYGHDDAEVKESFVETSRNLYRRFDFPVTLHRYSPTSEDRFPEEARRTVLTKVVRALTA